MYADLAAYVGSAGFATPQCSEGKTTMYNLNVFADIENMLATHHLITRVFAPRGIRQVIMSVALSTTLLSKPENEVGTSWKYIC